MLPGEKSVRIKEVNVSRETFRIRDVKIYGVSQKKKTPPFRCMKQGREDYL